MSMVISTLLHWLTLTALSLALGALLFTKLSSAGYPRTLAVVLCAIALLHPAFWNPATVVASVMFALMLYATAVSALAFERTQDARRTILLGSSLAGAQLVNPVCGLLSALSVPLVLRNVLSSGLPGRAVGQIVSLLFIPALIAVLVTYVWIAQHQSVPFWNPGSGARPFEAIENVAHSAVALAPLAIWLAARRKVGGNRETICALCAILVATGALDGFLGVRTAPDVTSAVDPLAIVVLSTGEWKDKRAASALLLITLSIAACWLPVHGIARLAGA